MNAILDVTLGIAVALFVIVSIALVILQSAGVIE